MACLWKEAGVSTPESIPELASLVLFYNLVFNLEE